MTSNSLAFVFPGQGSQQVGMLNDIAESHLEILAAFSEASDVLGYDLWQLASNGPPEELDKTVHTQPILLTASCALWRILQNQTDLKPNLLAGHSLGEYSALVAAEAIDFKDAVKLVALRGQYMQEASPAGEGGLGVIVGLDDQAVLTICEKSALPNEVLSPVNFNSPGQVVVGGTLIAVERALVLAKEAGSKLAKLLPVSVPSHCILMKPAADKLSQILNEIKMHDLKIPVLNNADVEIYTSPESIRDGLTKQLYMPVRWVETIQKFSSLGINRIIECGPGKVLSGLIKRIVPEVQVATTADLKSLNSLLKTEMNTLGV